MRLSLGLYKYESIQASYSHLGFPNLTNPSPDFRQSLSYVYGIRGAAYLGQRIDGAIFGTGLVQRLRGGISGGRACGDNGRRYTT